jgi:hypothetical protein
MALFYPHPAAGPVRFPSPFLLSHGIKGLRRCVGALAGAHPLFASPLTPPVLVSTGVLPLSPHLTLLPATDLPPPPLPLPETPLLCHRSAYAVPTPPRTTSCPKRLHPPALSATGEPAFTTYHSGLQTCVDFVWYSSDVMHRVGLVECLPPDVLYALGTLPSRNVPSDHMCLVADFKLVLP